MSSPVPQSHALSSQPLPVGYRLGEYQIEAVLGHGGFGITYRARDTLLGAEVAIKEYFPQVYAARTQHATIVPRPGADLENYRWGLAEFLKEARVLAKFKHPHIVRVLRFLEANGTAYTIMEYEQGATLTSRLEQGGGRLDEPALLRIFLPILSGLQAVHDQGLLHLDIKPDNIYLRSNGEPMLIDFGSSRQVRGDEGGKITLTPGYCALEQYPGYGEIGARADVYGVGATLYRCITGTRPIDARERHETYARRRSDPLRPAMSFERPFYSAHVRQCIDLAMKLEAGERPATAHVLQQGLMGKDMSQVGKPVRTDVVRLGQGFIGELPPPKVRKWRRRYSFFEKLVVTLVFLATAAIVTPKLLMDTGRLNEQALFDAIDNARTQVTTRARAVGEYVNERFFGVPRRPEPSAPPPVAHAPAPAVTTEPPPPPPPPPPFGDSFVREADIVLPAPAQIMALVKHGTVLALAMTDGPIRLWDVASGAERVTIPARIPGAGAIGVFPSTQAFVVADGVSTLAVFDPLGQRETMIVDDLTEPVVAIAVSREQHRLAVATVDGRVTVWALNPTRRLRTLSLEGVQPAALAFAGGDTQLVVGAADGYVSVWDIDRGERGQRWRAHAHPISAIDLSLDGRRLASVSRKGEVRLWTLGAAATDTPLTLAGKAQHLAFTPDGRWLLVAGHGPGIRVVDVDSGAAVHELATDGRAIRGLALTGDGKLLIALGDDNVVRRWR